MVGPGLMVVESGYTVTAYSCPACEGVGWPGYWRWDKAKQRDVIENRRRCRACNGTGIVLSADEPRLSQLVGAGETQ